MINIGAKLQNRKLIQIISLFNRKYVLKNRVIADIVKQKKNKKAILFY